MLLCQVVTRATDQERGHSITAVDRDTDSGVVLHGVCDCSKRVPSDCEQGTEHLKTPKASIVERARMLCSGHRQHILVDLNAS
jgi:hypothetical protein